MYVWRTKYFEWGIYGEHIRSGSNEVTKAGQDPLLEMK